MTTWIATEALEKEQKQKRSPNVFWRTATQKTECYRHLNEPFRGIMHLTIPIFVAFWFFIGDLVPKAVSIEKRNIASELRTIGLDIHYAFETPQSGITVAVNNFPANQMIGKACCCKKDKPPKK
jgi:hypothetical protein